MANQTSSHPKTLNLLNALSTLVGYIGTEAAPDDLFERLLWPQRFYNGFTASNAAKAAVLMPMGGPLHKAAINTLDRLFKNQLLKGDHLGHMLGCGFFHDSGLRYTAYGHRQEQEYVRNGLWTRVLAQMPIPVTEIQKGHQSKDSASRKHRVRQMTSVRHLILSQPRSDQHPSGGNIACYETGNIILQTISAIVVTESVGIITAIVVAVAWRSCFMILWLIPLFLKLLSALFTVPREGFTTPQIPKTDRKDDEGANHMKKFEIHTNYGQNFQIIEGHEPLVLQFFRHYGHPIRKRSSELTQIAIVTAFALVFPLGLICSFIWMPIQIQYTWLGYQLYATLAMYFYRYGGGYTLATTEEKIAKSLTEAEGKIKHIRILIGGGGEVIVATLSTTYHSNYAEGRDRMNELLHGRLGHDQTTLEQNEG